MSIPCAKCGEPTPFMQEKLCTPCFNAEQADAHIENNLLFDAGEMMKQAEIKLRQFSVLGGTQRNKVAMFDADILFNMRLKYCR